MKSVWIVEEGAMFSSSMSIYGVYATKALAEKTCRAEGYRWSKEDRLFISNDEWDWRSLRKYEVVNDS